MVKTIQALAIVLAGCLLGGCEPHFDKSIGGPVEIIPESARIYIPAPTKAAARAAVFRGMRHAPTRKFYVLDSTHVRSAGDYWHVLVLRNDSAGHRLAYVRFDVNKATGDVRCIGLQR